MKPEHQTLVFTMAFNGYQYLYQDFIATHKAYAQAHGYDFLAISKPGFCSLGMECAWLKLCLLQRALQLGYHRVLFVDADASISPDTPPLDACFQPDKSLYMARGYSGRFNSGVIIACRQAELMVDLERLIAAPHSPIPEEDQVGWGENGHLINLARQRNYVGELDGRWNNNYRPDLADFIRHYSAGPMRALFKAKLSGWVSWWICQLWVRVMMKLRPRHPRDFAQRLSEFAQRLFCRYGLELNAAEVVTSPLSTP